MKMKWMQIFDVYYKGRTFCGTCKKILLMNDLR